MRFKPEINKKSKKIAALSFSILEKALMTELGQTSEGSL
jgi:hypothetical protein